MAYRLHFKWICMALCLLGMFCGEVPRDNVLDPKNPNSIVPQKVMIEAFVNTNNPSSVNEYALQALDSLSILYGDRIIIAEYHRNTTDYTDPYHLDKNELLYQNYVAQFDNVKGVPDIYINGSNQRVQGASSVSYSLFRLEAALIDDISQNTSFIFDVEIKRQNDRIQPEVLLARLGTQNMRNILVKAMIVSHVNSPDHKRVVQSIVESNAIPYIARGEQLNVILPEMTIDPSVINTLVVYVTDMNGTTIYQCASQEI